MDPAAVMELARAGLVLTLTLAGPMLLTSLIVGVSIGLFQALTQIQEQTLTFVPKIVAVGLVMLLSLPMIGDTSTALKGAEAASARQVAGKGDLVDVVTAIGAAEMALDTVVAVRDKVVGAYSEIMRMQI